MIDNTVGTCCDDTTSIKIAEASYRVGSPSAPASLEGDQYGTDMGESQIIVGSDNHTNVLIEHRIIDARTYLQSTVMIDTKYEKVRTLCKNQHSHCAFWAASGECTNNPGYMKVNCGPVCMSCEQLHVETRCPLDSTVPSAFDKPGDLNTMFENIITNPNFQQYKPIVISRPTLAYGDTIVNATYKTDSIWMIAFDNMITDDEADRLIELGSIQGYERSADVGELKDDGTYGSYVNNGRTSTNAWCVNECYNDTTAQNVMNRIATVTGIPEVNSENLQLLKYNIGQYYNTHNDYIEYQKERPCGVRILTFYIYLNNVEEGGGTNFPTLNVTVQPKKGRAVLWPSVYDTNPNIEDPRSIHQALPVIQGIKYGANAWIHQRDFKTNNHIGCT